MYYLYLRLSRSNTLNRSCNLTTLSNDTLRPLNTFTRVPPVTEGVFARLEPMLKVFLASNNLNALPEALFNLPHVTVLSLRANEIQDLNPAIGRLKNLTELNLSQNRLQYLPYEILDLFLEDSNLQTFQIHPNPFHEPQLSTTADNKKNVIPRYPFRQNRPRRTAICGISPDQIRRSFHPQWKLTYKARTQVRYLDMNGSEMQGPRFSNQSLFGPQKFPNGIPLADVDDIPTPPRGRGNPVCRVPSLLEVALNACSQSFDVTALALLLPKFCPETFPILLANAAAKKEDVEYDEDGKDLLVRHFAVAFRVDGRRPDCALRGFVLDGSV